MSWVQVEGEGQGEEDIRESALSSDKIAGVALAFCPDLEISLLLTSVVFFFSDFPAVVATQTFSVSFTSYNNLLKNSFEIRNFPNCISYFFSFSASTFLLLMVLVFCWFGGLGGFCFYFF